MDEITIVAFVILFVGAGWQPVACIFLIKLSDDHLLNVCETIIYTFILSSDKMHFIGYVNCTLQIRISKLEVLSGISSMQSTVNIQKSVFDMVSVLPVKQQQLC